MVLPYQGVNYGDAFKTVFWSGILSSRDRSLRGLSSVRSFTVQIDTVILDTVKLDLCQKKFDYGYIVRLSFCCSNVTRALGRAKRSEKQGILRKMKLSDLISEIKSVPPTQREDQAQLVSKDDPAVLTMIHDVFERDLSKYSDEERQDLTCVGVTLFDALWAMNLDHNKRPIGYVEMTEKVMALFETLRCVFNEYQSRRMGDA